MFFIGTLTAETTTVPNHAGRDLARPLTRQILRDNNLSVDEFEKTLNAL